jgi:hypothetical protein
MWLVGRFARASAQFREGAALRSIAGELAVQVSGRPLSGPASIFRGLFSTCAGFEQEYRAHTRTDGAMSVSSEVQRTLVKSPPELWAELSDPAALARHLGELGEIRITRVEPEKTVEWEGTNATGAVRLKPSGWGTKVTLTVTREVPEPEPIVQPVAEPESEPAAETQPAVETKPEPEAAAWPTAEPALELEPAAEAEPAAKPEPASRRGFFARIFGRRPKVEPVAEPEPVTEFEPEPEAEFEPEAEAEPEPQVQEEPQPDLAAELAALEESLVAETQAVLTTVLDRLGAAHHRPFSRS